MPSNPDGKFSIDEWNSTASILKDGVPEATVDGDVYLRGGLHVDGTQVVAGQRAGPADPTWTTVNGTGDDATINANFDDISGAINDLLADLRAHGLIQ